MTFGLNNTLNINHLNLRFVIFVCAIFLILNFDESKKKQNHFDMIPYILR